MTVVGQTRDGEDVYFQHPSVQCGFMFFGEFLCLVPYFVWKWVLKRKRQGGNPTERNRISAMVTSPSELDLMSGRVQQQPPTVRGNPTITEAHIYLYRLLYSKIASP
jgi:hypothetical protein